METLECGHEESPHSDITRGYGRDDKGNRHCYTCCEKRDRESLKTETRLFAYLSKAIDGTLEITAWPGWKLATVTTIKTHPTNFGGSLSRFWARDVFGQYWVGSSPGVGMYARLRLSAESLRKRALLTP